MSSARVILVLLSKILSKISFFNTNNAFLPIHEQINVSVSVCEERHSDGCAMLVYEEGQRDRNTARDILCLLPFTFMFIPISLDWIQNMFVEM